MDGRRRKRSSREHTQTSLHHQLQPSPPIAQWILRGRVVEAPTGRLWIAVWAEGLMAQSITKDIVINAFLCIKSEVSVACGST